jgi:lipoprotein NlpD
MKTRLLLAGAFLLAAGCASQRPAPIEERGIPRGGAPIGHITPEQPELYTVKPGDTLYSIARAQGLDVSQLRTFNNMNENSAPLQTGQVLRLRPAVPAQAAAPQPAEPEIQVNTASALPPVEQRSLDAGPVASGAAGAAAAGAQSGVPGAPAGTEAGAASPGLAAAVPATGVPGAHGNVKTEPRVFTLPYSADNLAMVQRGDSKPPQAKPDDNAAAAGKSETPSGGTAPGGSPPQDTQAALSPPNGTAKPTDSIDFIWPVVGKVIEKFEGTSKGIDIAASDGDPVEAAAAGNVLYAGSGIRGYGQLLIIKHNDDFLSVYAHNNKLLVKQGESVKQGQKIAEAGHTDSDRPMLHFEIRRQGNSVDPLKYLPQR